ncbi:putative NmrA-like domain, NAD(P)-binding domain superfamily [Septoria linicola]|nr:putative NmrA-like domain, NAD(P)-binding domain superfamily [Septoria linicola]
MSPPSSHPSTLVVFGATGNQGGSVIKTVLNDPVLSKKSKLRAISRDASKPQMLAFAKQGVEVCVSMSADIEFAQAKAVVDAAKAIGVQHLIFSSLINVSNESHGRLVHVSHFDGKARVEQYIRDSGLAATFVLPGLFMSQFVDMIRKNEDGSFMLALPVDGDKARIPLHDVTGDTGTSDKVSFTMFQSNTQA